MARRTAEFAAAFLAPLVLLDAPHDKTGHRVEAGEPGVLANEPPLRVVEHRGDAVAVVFGGQIQSFEVVRQPEEERIIGLVLLRISLEFRPVELRTDQFEVQDIEERVCYLGIAPPGKSLPSGFPSL